MAQKTNNPAVIKIELPEEVFDAPDAVIYRLKRVSVARIDALRSAQTAQEVYKNLAVIYPRWSGVLDSETGEELPSPEADPTVFERLDSLEQLPWLNEQLRPGKK